MVHVRSSPRLDERGGLPPGDRWRPSRGQPAWSRDRLALGLLRTLQGGARCGAPRCEPTRPLADRADSRCANDTAFAAGVLRLVRPVATFGAATAVWHAPAVPHCAWRGARGDRPRWSPPVAPTPNQHKDSGWRVTRSTVQPGNGQRQARSAGLAQAPAGKRPAPRGRPRCGSAAPPDYATFWKMTVALCPPKPKELLIATLTGCCTCWPKVNCKSPGRAGSTWVVLIVGGILPS